MKTVYKNKFLDIILDEANGIIEMAWKSAAADMTDEEFKAIFLHYVELTEKYHPHSLLVHSQEQSYVVMPHMQQWLDTHVIPRAYWAGVKKVALVVSKDIFVQISVEQIMDEPHAQWLQARFFSSVELAREWLLSQKNCNN
ncbi:MAG: hypothetical protein RMJ87_13775 [Cytophagales bacterium]|nr:hypothetical protein [Bernardetiaceae bacterium]MDW8206092.1 hypothetical protein [Cytophagales bacterium]